MHLSIEHIKATKWKWFCFPFSMLYIRFSSSLVALILNFLITFFFASFILRQFNIFLGIMKGLKCESQIESFHQSNKIFFFWILSSSTLYLRIICLMKCFCVGLFIFYGKIWENPSSLGMNFGKLRWKILGIFIWLVIFKFK